MDHIGTSPSRPDGTAKVSGRAQYTDDLTLPGMLYGATVRSPHPHARIRSVRWNQKKAPPGSFCVTAGDLPGPNGVMLLDDTWPVLAAETTHHVGEPVALVAAPTRREARLARNAVEVEYEPLPAVLTWEEAERGESLSEHRVEDGNVESALREADIVVEGEYRTGPQEHIYIEPQGMIAWFETDGTLHILGSMQCPYYVSGALAHALGLPQDKMRVKPAAVGGAFGGKEDFPSLIALHAALLARATGRPVKIVYDRHEDIIATTKRHPGLVRHRTGVSRDGRLTAMDIEVLLDGGAYRTLSPVVLSRGVLHASGAYRCPNVRVHGRVLRTHTAPNGAFRGFGAPQVLFAVERHMDRIARAVRLDPLEIRLRNVAGPGDRLPTGQVLREDASARLCLERVAAKTRFRRRWKANERARKLAASGNGTGSPVDGKGSAAGHHPAAADLGSSAAVAKPGKGIGISLYFHGSGFTGLGEHKMRSPVTVRLTQDGRIEVLCAATEMGQGMVSALPLIAAEAAGVRLDDILMHEPETGVVPDSGPTVASRTTMVVGGTISRAAARLRDRVLERMAPSAGGEPVRVRDGEVIGPEGSLGRFRDLARRYFAEHGDGELTVRNEPPAWQKFDEDTYQGDAYATYAWGADVMEVEVDPDTYHVRAVTASAVVEIGRAVHKLLSIGQIEGGTLQAIGYGLLEEMKLQDGRYLNDRLATYLIPTIQDAPRMDVEILERPWEGPPYGAKGIGELPMDGGAPAVVNAVENAIGIVADEIPATPEKLYAWEQAGRTVETLADSDRALAAGDEP